VTIESESRWHLDKRLNVGHILTTIVVASGLFVWGGKVETRLAVLESQYIKQEELQREIKKELIRMNEKLDRVVEIAIRNSRK
jgi:hypothetical protein